jgi:hypothetical protein
LRVTDLAHWMRSWGLDSTPVSYWHEVQQRNCGEPAISHDSHHVSLDQWTNLFASRHKGHRFKSPGGTYVNRDSPVSVVSLQNNDWGLQKNN